MKNNKGKSLLVGSLIILLIISTPYFLYLYKSIDPDAQNIKTLFGTLKAGYYPSVQTYIYSFFAKFVPLILLVIWFLTNKHWWVHALSIPIMVYLFQLISIVNDSEDYFDEIEFIYAVPITVAVVVILYFLRSKLSIYILAVDLKKEMDENMKDPKKIGK
ncbi:MAG: hypothetical protein QM495_07520 [Lutibacter sp.]|uniref:hypothetical protein n=1 Tax=Lutibacter sp. TaxID=1925666 RepID=UPI00385EE4EB